MTKPILFFILLLATTVSAQNLERSIVASAGDNVKNTCVDVSFTLGELIISTECNDVITLTQGFQQSNLISTTIKSSLENDLELNIYPNPVIDFIHISVNTLTENLSYKLFSLDGKLLKSDKLFSTENKIDITDYKQSMYFLSIVNRNGKTVRTYKLLSDK